MANIWEQGKMIVEHYEMVEKEKRKRRRKVIIIMQLLLLIICMESVLSWSVYRQSIPEKKIYFTEKFDTRLSNWSGVDARWINVYKKRNGVIKLSKSRYAVADYWTKLPDDLLLSEKIVFHFRILVSGFTNSAAVLFSLFWEKDAVAVVLNKNGKLGISTGMFKEVTYQRETTSRLTKNKWEDIYLSVDTGDNSYSVSLNGEEVAGGNFEIKLKPAKEIWLGSVWLYGREGYGAPKSMYYDIVTIGNKGLLPKISFSRYLGYRINRIKGIIPF